LDSCDSGYSADTKPILYKVAKLVQLDKIALDFFNSYFFFQNHLTLRHGSVVVTEFRWMLPHTGLNIFTTFVMNCIGIVSLPPAIFPQELSSEFTTFDMEMEGNKYKKKKNPDSVLGSSHCLDYAVVLIF
jgi:hypothetical protein